MELAFRDGPPLSIRQDFVCLSCGINKKERDLLMAGKAGAEQPPISRMKLYLWIVLVLLTAEEADALQAPELCYVLDGILFVYGIVLTFLYCRLKIHYQKNQKKNSTDTYEKVEGIYMGLGACEPETYTTLELPKRRLQEEPPKEESLEG